MLTRYYCVTFFRHCVTLKLPCSEPVRIGKTFSCMLINGKRNMKISLEGARVKENHEDRPLQLVLTFHLQSRTHNVSLCHLTTKIKRNFFRYFAGLYSFVLWMGFYAMSCFVYTWFHMGISVVSHLCSYIFQMFNQWQFHMCVHEFSCFKARYFTCLFVWLFSGIHIASDVWTHICFPGFTFVMIRFHGFIGMHWATPIFKRIWNLVDTLTLSYPWTK